MGRRGFFKSLMAAVFGFFVATKRDDFVEDDLAGWAKIAKSSREQWSKENSYGDYFWVETIMTDSNNNHHTTFVT